MISLEVVGWPIVKDTASGTYYIAQDASGGTRRMSPRTWQITEIEPLESTMLRLLREQWEAAGNTWEEDDE
ncbi:MAG: hypothetical protein ACXVHB_05825 [Solirubrobacteraceae bacterium]